MFHRRFIFYLIAIVTLLSGSGFSVELKPPPPGPTITISRAYSYRFPVPYGYGLKMEYTFDLHLDEAPYRKGLYITTEYSPDGINWVTDEEQRPLSYNWDNIHGEGDFACGPTIYNLESDHTYYLRAILTYTSYNDRYEEISNVVQATVEDYSELCLEEQIAEKFAPVLHRNLNDLQPMHLANVDNVGWASRKVFDLLGSPYPSNGINKYSYFHWQYGWKWDTWGIGQSFAFFKWDINDNERYKSEVIGERPLYFHVYKKGAYYYAQYWYFLTMNDIRAMASKHDPWHEGDFEHVSIELEKIGDNFVPRRVNFYLHEGGWQYPASECWWGSQAMNPGGAFPQQGYDENHTHLHVWIGANSHASFNYKEPIYQLVGKDNSVFTDNVDYTLGYTGVGPGDAYYRWDYMANLGEIKSSSDTDGDGYINAHGYEWFEHSETVPAWFDFQWLPFRGQLGDYWCQHMFIKSTCTKSPPSPAFGLDWLTFSDNDGACGGFGNHDAYFFGIEVATKQFLDPDTGAVVCTR
ncbi:MAG: hypothetical protein A2Z14_16865 [Chloroflexi bacterium RBG_16_48_8]|nr:MAG: hypothetical protein A2Z14_16865 [Chloroflexi bacterium RBG_16_48_8]